MPRGFHSLFFVTNMSVVEKQGRLVDGFNYSVRKLQHVALQAITQYEIALLYMFYTTDCKKVTLANTAPKLTKIQEEHGD